MVMGRLEDATGNSLAGLWFIIILTACGAVLAWGLRGGAKKKELAER